MIKIKLNPISMMNTVVKIYERLLHPRLYDHLDQFIPTYQYGFRRKLGASDQAVRFLELLQRNRNNGLYSVVLYTDIRKAYDRVCRRTLVIKLHRLGVCGRMLKAIMNLIMNRICVVLLGGYLAPAYEPDEGIPQGSVLSPLLWNLFF